MSGRRARLGILLGLVTAVLIGPFMGAPADSAVPSRGSVLSDADGRLCEIVIQYVCDGAGIVETAYRQFLGRLPDDVRVRVVCPDEAAFDDLRQRVGEVPPTLVPLYTRHAMTCWSRDRWLAFEPDPDRGATLVMSPRVEDGEEVWPRRAGDKRIGDDLEAGLDGVRSWRAPLAFDGGDFVVDKDMAFVSPRVARRNVGVTVATKAALARHLSDWLGRPVVLLDEAPDHHAGMYLMLAGGRTAVVGDPAEARRLVDAAGAALPVTPDWSVKTQSLFDAVARRCAEAGYRVVRIPVVPGSDGRTYITYLNAVLDERPSGRVIYMPRFDHADVLNRAAAGIWRDLGYAVHPIDCTDAYVHFGSLRCLVNVLRRG